MARKKSVRKLRSQKRKHKHIYTDKSYGNQHSKNSRQLTQSRQSETTKDLSKYARASEERSFKFSSSCSSEENLKTKKNALSHKQLSKNLRTHLAEESIKRNKKKKKRLTIRSDVSEPQTVEGEEDFWNDDEWSKKEQFPELVVGYVNRRTTNHLKLGFGKEETKFGLPDVECIRCGKTGHFFKLCPSLRS